MALAFKRLRRLESVLAIKGFLAHSERVAIFFLGLATFFLALSPWLSRHALILAVIFSLVAGNWNKAWYAIRNLRFIQWSLVLIALLAMSIGYSIAGLKHGSQALFHYTKLLYIPLLIPLFQTEKVRRGIIFCLIGTAIFASVLILLAHWEIFSVSFFKYSPLLFSDQTAGFLINPIPASVIQAFAFYFALDLFLKNKVKIYYLFIANFIFLSLFTVNSERTGCFIALMLLAFLLWKYFIVKKKYFIAIFFIGIMPVLSYQAFPAFQYRVTDFIANFSTKPASQETSIGLRVQFALNSFKIIREHPLLGVGAGGFLKAYQAIGGKRLNTAPLNDPHNSYLLMAVQLGVIGLSVYLCILVAAWLEIQKLGRDPEAQWFARATLAAFMFNGLTNVTIAGTAFGNIYVILLSSFFTGILRNRDAGCADSH